MDGNNIPSPMKSILTALAAAAAFGIAAPSTANAGCASGQTRVVGYTSCGTPIVAVYQIVGYDAWGRPIGQWITPPTAPGYGFGVQRPIAAGPNYGYGYGHHHHGNRGYTPGCGSPRRGINFSFGFGR